jgi:hypothetical protein
VVHWFETKILYAFAAPYEVMCDCGGKFLGAFQEVCNDHSIKITRGSAYHPETQGLVERANQTLERALATMTGNASNTWESHLHKAVFGINATPQASTR